MNIIIKVFGQAATSAKFLALAAAVGPGVEGVVHTFGMLLETKVKGKASGRPGPNVITGQYRRSITTEYSGSGETAEAKVGTNAVQARRLEFGFVGRDALGRDYNQPPFPHFTPAAAEIEGPFVAALAAVMPK